MKSQRLKDSVTSVFTVLVPVATTVSLILVAISLAEPDMLPVWFTRSLFYSGLAVFFISYAGRLKMIRRPAGFHFLATIFMVVDLIWLVAAIAIAAHGFIAVPTRLYRSAYSVWVPASAFICYASALNILVGGWATGTSERKD